MSTEEMFNWVRARRLALLSARKQGDSDAMTIIIVCNMCLRSPDTAALAMLEEAIKEYREREKV